MVLCPALSCAVLSVFAISQFRDTVFFYKRLRLNQNILPSKDVREYVFWYFLMPGRSQKCLGMILNVFWMNSGIIIFIKILTSFWGVVIVIFWPVLACPVLVLSCFGFLLLVWSCPDLIRACPALSCQCLWPFSQKGTFYQRGAFALNSKYPTI